MPRSTPRWSAAGSRTRASRARLRRATTGKRGIVVEFTNGCTFAFPPRFAQGLEAATDDQLATVEILGRGYGLHWEALDLDLSLPGLMAELFGTKAWMPRRAG